MINFEKFSKAVSGLEEYDEWFPLFYYGDGVEDCITVGDLRSVVAAQQSVQSDDYWRCVKCREYNPVNKGFCGGCGETRR
jgi:hypothetical protein